MRFNCKEHPNKQDQRSCEQYQNNKNKGKIVDYFMKVKDKA
jgi:hypothetical protein